MATQPTMSGIAASLEMRLRSDQGEAINQVRALRQSAKDLRSTISLGSYGDDELRQFWQLAETAGLVLMASNSELAERAGLGASYFMSVVRDRRRPKIHNFLKAITAIIDLADERLSSISNSDSPQPGDLATAATADSETVFDQYSRLLPFALSLAQLARAEIEKLDSVLPNDPDSVNRLYLRWLEAQK